MRDRTRRRNYSMEAEEFRREHARRREWGLTQRHARKLSRWYGSTANAEAAFQCRADELISASGSARAAEPTSSEPVGPEPPASAFAPPEPVRPKAIGSEPVEPEPVEPVELVESEPVGVEDAASVSGPSGSLSGNASRWPDRRFGLGRQVMRRQQRPGKHPRPVRKGTYPSKSARRIRPGTATESPENPAHRNAGMTAVKGHASAEEHPGRTSLPIPKDRREHIPRRLANTTSMKSARTIRTPVRWPRKELP